MAYLMAWQVKAAIIIALMVIVYALFLSKDVMFTRNRIWLVSALILPWFVPVLAMPDSVRSILFAEKTAVELSDMSIPFTDQTSVATQNAYVWQWSHLLVGVYLLVSLMFVVRLVWGYIYLLKLKGKSKKLNVEGLNLYLLEDKEINPFSFFQSVFVPQKVMEQADRDHILNHEQTHCLQWHSIDITLVEWMLILQWWNSFAWWLRKLIAQNHEFCVDKAMMQVSEEPKQYQYSLINYLPGSTNLRLVNNFSQSLIKKRIIMMNNTIQNKFKTQLKGVFVAALTAIALLACTDSDKTTSDNEVETLAGRRSVIEYADGTNYSVILTDKGFEEESSNAKGALFLLNDEVVGWSLIKGLKPEQVKAFGSIPVGNNRKGLLPADNNGAISVYTVDYEFPKSTFDRTKAIYYIDGERLEELPAKITPEQIKEINVLKGEAAVEKYGVDHRDGVIEVTTKKPEEVDGKADIIINGAGRATRID